MNLVKLVWVAALSGCYGVGAKYYGPSETPIQIPENLAQSLGLEEIAEADALAQLDIQPVVVTQVDLSQVQALEARVKELEGQLDKANTDLKAEQQAKGNAEARVKELEGQLSKLKPK